MKRVHALLSLTLAAAAITAVTVLASARSPEPAPAAPPTSPEYAAAVGAFLDHPTSAGAIERGIAVGDALAARYRAQGKTPAARRAAAAKLAEADVAEIVFTDEEIQKKALSLGVDLSTCEDLCAEVRRWTVAELRRDALVDIAEGRRPAQRALVE